MIGHWTVLLPAILLDLILGDPHWMPHPVRWMGAMIAGLENMLRGLLPKTPRGERLGGILMALLVGGTFCGGSALLLYALAQISPWLAWGVEVWLTYQLLAARAGAGEHGGVPLSCQRGPARRPYRCIPHRGPGHPGAWTRRGWPSAVETVAENTCDGWWPPDLFVAVRPAPGHAL